MARIAGVDLPREKRVEIGLTYVYGIGRVSAAKILEKAQVNPDTRVRELTDDEVKRISEVIDAEYMVCLLYTSGIDTVVFDRGGFIYQGKIAALAEAAREAGLNF